MKSFQLIDARSPQEAASLLNKYKGKAQPLAGGGDLLYLMKDRIEGRQIQMPDVLVNLESIPKLDSISYEKGKGLKLGAMALVSDVEANKTIRERFPILAQAAAEVASPQLRNMGTVGGNLCQKPRCWYYRNAHLPCLKKGGSTCYALEGDNRYYHAILEGGPCYIVHPSDLAPALIALNSQVALVGPKQSRTIPLESFFVNTKQNLYQENVLKPDEIVQEVSVPEPKEGSRGFYLKSRIRKSWDFALASAAVQMEIAGGVCRDCRIVLGGVAPLPYRAKDAETALKGKKINEQVALKVAEEALKAAQPMSMNAYKVDLAKTLLKRAVLQAGKV
ncbi:MAG: xanthine dehydrogenase family protein subunit M [Deltaproteobacteria bacterium]|nr:xanthine dehydrogenase family protein subunit M [Deltaproteobacteria bacterium]